MTRRNRNAVRPREVAIYDGQIFIGRVVVEERDDFIAFDAAGKCLGRFESQAAAAFSIGAAKDGDATTTDRSPKGAAR
jgi:hypothetical protein